MLIEKTVSVIIVVITAFTLLMFLVTLLMEDSNL
jgi:hypothetical protein